jgi:hypothetical protein
MEDDMKIASIAATAFLVLSLAHSTVKSHPDDMLRRIEPFLTTVRDGLDELDSELTKIEQQASIVPATSASIR